MRNKGLELLQQLEIPLWAHPRGPLRILNDKDGNLIVSGYHKWPGNAGLGKNQMIPSLPGQHKTISFEYSDENLKVNRPKRRH